MTKSSSLQEVPLGLSTLPTKTEQPIVNMKEKKTLRELNEPPEIQSPICLGELALGASLDFMYGLIQLLPKFRGLDNEDPYRHLKEFHLVCLTLKPQYISEEQVKLRAFPYSLDDAAKEWLLYLPGNSINTWKDMRVLFMERFFPASRVMDIMREIHGIMQNDHETLYEYFERFRRLCASCPRNDISEQSCIVFFYDGLLPYERMMINAASGGNMLDNKTHNEAIKLISDMAETSHPYGGRRQDDLRRDNEVNNLALVSQKINQLSDLVDRVVKLNYQGHPTNMCPALEELKMSNCKLMPPDFQN